MNNLQQDFLRQSIANLENLIDRLRKEDSTGSFSENFSRESFRLLHTIKGTSQTFGFPASGNLAHELENLLFAAKNRQISAGVDCKNLLLEGLETLRRTFERQDFEIPAEIVGKIRAAAPVESENDSEIFASRLPAEIFSQLSNREKTTVNSALRIGKDIFCLGIGFDLANFADELTDFREDLSEKCEIIATLPGAKFSGQGKIGFQILLAASENIEEIIEKHSAEIIFQTARQEFSGDLRGVSAQVAAHGKSLAEQLYKEVEFEVSGAETEISPELLKIVFDALLHLVRNAVDHAIEKTNERIAANKKPQGQIKINFSGAENDFRLTISDDGRGIDAEKIRTKAIEKKLISGRENLSEQSLLDLIFKPEFSTAERLTEISGRGIGLDAVKDSVEKIGGKIIVKSRKQTGTTFEISLPKEI